MSALNVGLVAVFFAVAFTPHAIGQETVDRNVSRLIPQIMDGTDPGLIALFPPELLSSDTAIAVRNAFQYAVTGWDTFAVCDPAEKALNFWGKREQLPKKVCEDGETPGIMFAYSLMRAMEREFPEATDSYKEIMKEAGFDPEDRSTDMSTAIGMANVIGTRLADWMANDGWNSLGDLSRSEFRQRFEDYTGYTPVNPPWSLNYPLRWQPLTQADSKIGRFTVQTHVVPFLGQVRPLLITEEEVESRKAPMPYENMDSKELSGKDKETMDALVKDLFEISANLTPKQRFLARWWDNKLLSVGFFLAMHNSTEVFDPSFSARWGLGEMLAEYDAMIVVWKEKRRIDAVRPETIIANFYNDEEVTAYVPKEGKAKTIKAGDWEPIIPTQPHSEYPSASASLCTAFADQAELMMKEHMEAKNLDKEVPFVFKLDTFVFPPGFDFEGTKEIRFETMKEAAESCGQSRLWAGVHFGPSVPAGEKLAEGIGQKAYDFVKKLAEGEVPENCWWCEKSEK
ncbi:hypothetical protein BSKO_10492 [Bryopsis sp. KO-2023]|nr:hypothetical protein BSKO_10492 [Bryopsis sp. KO-2023]